MLGLIWGVCAIAPPVHAQSPNVLLDHWAYSFIDRLETKGLFRSEDFSTRPYSRQAFAEIIQHVHHRTQHDPAVLSEVEWGLFERLKGEFHEELRELESGDTPRAVLAAKEGIQESRGTKRDSAAYRRLIEIQDKEKEPHLYTWQTEELTVHFESTFRQQLRFESREAVDVGIPTSITSVGLGGRANLKGSMIIFVDAFSAVLSDTDTLTNTVFNPSLGLPVTEKALVDVAITDNATAYIAYRLPWFDLEFGRDQVEWGPGFRGNLMLSRNSNVYDLLKLTFRYGRAKLEYFHAFLNSDKSKYLAAHRLEIRPVRNLQLAVSESVVYGDRSVEPFYLNPFVPIIISERHVGNKDNNMLGFDGSLYLPRQRLKLYGEVLFDDFSFAKDIFESFGNKWGLLVGGYWVDPFGLANTGLRLEAVRIQPFVYSHRTPVNTYSNYNNTLGHWLGPDADDWYVEIAHQPHRNLRWSVSWEQRRRGENDINFGTRPENGHVKFLDGPAERNRAYGIAGEWQLHRDVFVSASYQYLQSKNLRRQDGFDQNNHRLFLRLSVNH